MVFIVQIYIHHWTLSIKPIKPIPWISPRQHLVLSVKSPSPGVAAARLQLRGLPGRVRHGGPAVASGERGVTEGWPGRVNHGVP